MATVDRYVGREVVLSWLAVTGVLVGILVSNQLAQVLGQAAERGYPRGVIVHLIALMSIQNLTVLIPVGVLLGVVLALGRLYHDSEMAALLACGVGPQRLLWPIGLLGAAVALALAWLALSVAPSAFARAEDIRQAALRSAQFSQLEPGKFHSFLKGTAVFYSEFQDPDGALRRVFIERHAGTHVEVVLADRATQRVEEDGAVHVLVLHEGDRYETSPGDPVVRRVHFADYGIPVRLEAAAGGPGRVEARTTLDLWRDPSGAAQSELQWRLSLPLMTVLLTLLSIPLAKIAPRQGRYSRIGVVVLLYFVYSNLLSAARTWMEKGWMPGSVGVWWVHALVAVLILWLWQPYLTHRRVRA